MKRRKDKIAASSVPLFTVSENSCISIIDSIEKDKGGGTRKKKSTASTCSHDDLPLKKYLVEEILGKTQQEETSDFAVWCWKYVLPMLTWVILFAICKSHPKKEWRCIPFIMFALPIIIPVLFPSLHVGAGTSFPSSWMLSLANKLRLEVIMIINKETKGPYYSHKVSAGTKNSFCTTSSVIGMHPHGRYPMDIMPWLEKLKSTILLDEMQKKDNNQSYFVNITLAQSSLGKFIPTIGYPTMLFGAIDITQKNISRSLQQGQSVALFPGGAREMTMCTPYSETIHLVKRYGFLKLVWRQARKRNDENNKQVNIQVFPSFIFGIYDSYSCPIARADKMLFDLTGMNIIFVWPTSRYMDDGTKNTMVLGIPLDPLDFTTVDDLANAYYSELVSLFEGHKRDHKNCAKRTIKFIEVRSDKKTSSVHTFIFISEILFLLLSTVFFYVSANRQWFLNGIGRAVEGSQLLHFHFLAATIWIITSGIQFIRTSSRFHKMSGYIAVTSALIMSLTGFSLVLSRSRTVVLTFSSGDMSDTFQDRFRSACHELYHSIANMVISLSLAYTIIKAWKAAYYRDFILHRRLVSVYNKSVLVNFLPRVIAVVFRYMFPFLSNEANYSLAITIVWKVQINSIRDTPKLWEKMKLHFCYSILMLVMCFPALCKLMVSPVQITYCNYIVSFVSIAISTFFQKQ